MDEVPLVGVPYESFVLLYKVRHCDSNEQPGRTEIKENCESLQQILPFPPAPEMETIGALLELANQFLMPHVIQR